MAMNPDIRWHQRLQSLTKAFARLSDAAALADQRDLSDLERQGLIQSFEFTFELSWLVLKDYLESLGFQDLRGPKPVIRKAFASEVIENGDVWLAMIESRNQSSHTYNEDVAGEIVDAILGKYVPAFTSFLQRLDQFKRTDQ